MLTTDDKADYLWAQGIHLIERFENNNVFSLFSLSDFFVEVQYNKLKNQIVAFHTFKKGNFLNPYLDLIPLL